MAESKSIDIVAISSTCLNDKMGHRSNKTEDMHGSRAGTRDPNPTPLENHLAIGFDKNFGTDLPGVEIGTFDPNAARGRSALPCVKYTLMTNLMF